MNVVYECEVVFVYWWLFSVLNETSRPSEPLASEEKTEEKKSDPEESAAVQDIKEAEESSSGEFYKLLINSPRAVS